MLSSTCSVISRSEIVPVQLQQAIGQRRLAVVDVGDDAEVANPAGVHSSAKYTRTGDCGQWSVVSGQWSVAGYQ